VVVAILAKFPSYHRVLSPSASYWENRGQARNIDYQLLQAVRLIIAPQPVGDPSAPKHKAHRRPVTLSAGRSGSFVPHFPRLLGSHRAWARALGTYGVSSIRSLQDFYWYFSDAVLRARGRVFGTNVVSSQTASESVSRSNVPLGGG